jgi:hypothetical protein
MIDVVDLHEALGDGPLASLGDGSLGDILEGSEPLV